MKVLLSVSLIAALTVGEAMAPNTVSAQELAGQQIAFTELYDACANRACNADRRYLGSRGVVMDVTGGQKFEMPVGAWSPDGKMILNAGSDLFLMPATGGTAINLTNHAANYTTPAWSPDGSRIAFASDRDGPLGLYVMNADGSNVAGLEAGVGLAIHPTWSPDGTRLAFTCIVDGAGNLDICVINADGSGFARLTNVPGDDKDPDWSPDGSRIVFDTERYGGVELAFIYVGDGSVAQVSPGVQGDSPRWSPDGTRIAFVNLIPYDFGDLFDPYDQYVTLIAPDGTLGPMLAWGYAPIWRPFDAASANYRPSASFTFACTDRTCSFDATSSTDTDGTLISYGWQFDDGAAAGVLVTHTFSSSHNVRLIVMDDRGALGTTVQNVNQPPVVSFTASCNGLTCTFDASASYDPDGMLAQGSWRYGDLTDSNGPAIVSHTYTSPGTYLVTRTSIDQDSASTSFSRTVMVNGPPNAPPNASFTYSCNGLLCTFNASASSDSDGTIASYGWNYGDGTVGAGVMSIHTFGSPGIYQVMLLVADNNSSTGTVTQSVQAYAPIHVGDLDVSTSTQGNQWTATATVTIHDHNHLPVANVVVSGSWNDGVQSCVTSSTGRCSLSRQGISKRTASVTFLMLDATLAMRTYTPSSNHDPDGDSNGTTATAKR